MQWTPRFIYNIVSFPPIIQFIVIPVVYSVKSQYIYKILFESIIIYLYLIYIYDICLCCFFFTCSLNDTVFFIHLLNYLN